jgi:hypothetical protein
MIQVRASETLYLRHGKYYSHGYGIPQDQLEVVGARSWRISWSSVSLDGVVAMLSTRVYLF